MYTDVHDRGNLGNRSPYHTSYTPPPSDEFFHKLRHFRRRNGQGEVYTVLAGHFVEVFKQLFQIVGRFVENAADAVDIDFIIVGIISLFYL